MTKRNHHWVCEAINRLNADRIRSSDTHLIPVKIPAFAEIDLYIKDESTHPTGSLKHRLARSLFLYGICNGKITENTPIIEASSGSTAISEAYFARLLGLRFIAVIPENTAPEKIKQIEFYGGECVKVNSCEIANASYELAASLDGYYMDQFTFAERATDWRSNNNIAKSIFKQMQAEPHPVPEWIVVGAGTGGTSATIGRYLRYNPELFAKTKLFVADVEHSVFYDYFQTGDKQLHIQTPSRIEGIGRPRVEPSFIREVVDDMMQVPDAASIASMRWFSTFLGKKVGASTGTNIYAALHLMQKMQAQGQTGSVVTLLCDSGERYLNTYYDDAWLSAREIDINPYLLALNRYL